MKIPEKIIIGGYNFKIAVTNQDNLPHGGSFDWNKKIITINDLYGEAESILLHELLETILTEQFTRFYSNEQSTNYRFMFNHTQFSLIVKELYAVLKNNRLI